ncbi:MAG: hypothetical protein HC915_16805, partial [Anaerolineae bacterium]|nr:hypothetical protein [Anaerolineae bacterium]
RWAGAWLAQPCSSCHVQAPPGALLLILLCTLSLAAFQVIAARQHTRQIHVALQQGRYQALSSEWLADLPHRSRLLLHLERLPNTDRRLLLVAQALAELGSQTGFEAIQARWAELPPALQAEFLEQIALSWANQRRRSALREMVTEALTSPAPEVRHAALHLSAQAPEWLDSYRVALELIHPDPSTSTLAAQLLLQHPAPRLAQAAAAQLNWLSRAGHAPTRALAISALIQGSQSRDGERRLPLEMARFLADPAVRVRLAALPGADFAALIQALQDPSPTVAGAAVGHLRVHRRRAIQAIRRQLASLRPSQQFSQ